MNRIPSAASLGETDTKGRETVFTAGEIDKVINQGVDPDAVPTVYQVSNIVGRAQDCGVLSSSITVWEIEGPGLDGFLVTVDIEGTSLRLSSRFFETKDIRPEPTQSMRDYVFSVLVWAEKTAQGLKNTLKAYVESR